MARRRNIGPLGPSYRLERAMRRQRKSWFVSTIIKLVLIVSVLLALAVLFGYATLSEIGAKLGIGDDASQIQEDETVIEDEAVEL